MSKNPVSILASILIHDESLELAPYKDSKGYWTYGIGRFIGRELTDLRISKNIALELLKEDIEKASDIVVRVFGKPLSDYSMARRDALICLAFNMGEGNDQRGLRSFKRMISAVKDSRWKDASKELLNSGWARDVDPKCIVGKGRDDRLAYMLETGEYHEKYNSFHSANVI